MLKHPLSRRPPRPLQVGAAVVAFLAAGLLASARWSDHRASRAAASPPELPAARLPGRGERVLVVAPHPDDETLALGGLLHEARRRGADVRVLFLTDGDGFPLCAAVRYRAWPDRPALRRLAGERRGEALRALERLGVPPSDVHFLGYPDRGLAELWLRRWTPTAPHASPHSGASSVHAGGSYRPGAPYCGQALLEDVQALLDRTAPHFVYYPHEDDDHPDHWSGGSFTRLALARLRRKPWARGVVARGYLVHRGEWPEPRGSREALSLHPPAPLLEAGRGWESLPLGPEARTAKREALLRHESQMTMAGDFLQSFLRRNELLGLPPERRQELPSLLLPDPTRDRAGRAVSGAVDFRSLEVATVAGLALRARLREPAAAWPVYSLHWKPVDGPADSLTTRTVRLQGYRCEPPGTRFSLQGGDWEVRVPAAALGGSGAVMVGADCWSGGVQLDRTAWMVVE